MRAADSLDCIHDHISVDDPEAADRTVLRIVEMCEGLSENPLRFRADERLGPDIRRFPVGPYIVFYRVSGDHVRILDVIHGARDMTRLQDLD